MSLIDASGSRTHMCNCYTHCQEDLTVSSLLRCLHCTHTIRTYLQIVWTCRTICPGSHARKGNRTLHGSLAAAVAVQL